MTEPLDLAWGHRGAETAAAAGRVVAIVDVLSFSTCVAAAVDRGARVEPCHWDEDTAPRAGGDVIVARPRPDPPRIDVPSLSPRSMAGLPPGRTLLLPSPNGATCTRLAAAAPRVYAGCLRNAAAVARALARHRARGEHVTVVACGERVHDDHADGPLRFALEDLLGAGALLAHLGGPRSADAEAAARQFVALADDVPDLVTRCPSGQELVERGYGADVAFAVALDASDAVPVLAGTAYERR